jgi:hypothetical protein
MVPTFRPLLILLYFISHVDLYRSICIRMGFDPLVFDVQAR